jgi:hypothetical protein
MLTYFDEEPINKSNAALELQKIHSQDLSLFFNYNYQILFTMRKLMQDAMKSPSSSITFLF